METKVVNHPLVASRLTIMRDKNSDNAAFRAALADLGAMLVYEAAGELGKVLLECGAETIEPAQLKQLIRASLTIGIGDALKRLSPA